MATARARDASHAPLPDEIVAYHAAQTAGDRAICDVLAQEIDGVLLREGAERKVWHGHPVWFMEGNPIVGYSRLKTPRACIRVLFWSGQSFDEAGLKPAPPGTKFKSADVRYEGVEEIDVKALRRWLKKSVGIQWDYANVVKRRGKLVRLK